MHHPSHRDMYTCRYPQMCRSSLHYVYSTCASSGSIAARDTAYLCTTRLCTACGTTCSWTAQVTYGAKSNGQPSRKR